MPGVCYAPVVPFETFDVNDLKLVYTTLQGQLLAVEELIDSSFLSELQDHLRARAEHAGVNTNDHAQWAAWLAAKRTPDPPKRLRLVED